MHIDLHSHTTASDGKLTPAQLLQRASSLELEILSITDHDTTAAYEQLAKTPASLTLIPGIEFSTYWKKTEIHILGLNIDLQNRTLQEGIMSQKKARELRAQGIAEKLSRVLKIENPFQAVAKLANNENIGRPHFAQYMLDNGLVSQHEDAFKKYLNAGKPAYVRQPWADYEEIIDWIVISGGIAVLAHPGKYNLTRTKLISLIDDFERAGGGGLEVISGSQNPNLTHELTKLCEQKGLLASCGSDFHQPELSWSDLGKFPPLPKSCRPVWEHW